MSENGRLLASELDFIPGTSKRLRADLIPQTAALRAAFAARFGKPLSITDAYRPYAEQVRLFTRNYTTVYAQSTGKDRKVWDGRTWWRRPGWPSAAKPGTSNHGWGRALDLGSGVNSGLRSDEHLWMRANGGRFGWVHPAWAHDLTRVWMQEAWHFEATVVPVANYLPYLTAQAITVPGVTLPAPLEEDDMPTPAEIATAVWSATFGRDTRKRTAYQLLDEARTTSASALALAREVAARPANASAIDPAEIERIITEAASRVQIEVTIDPPA